MKLVIKALCLSILLVSWKSGIASEIYIVGDSKISTDIISLESVRQQSETESLVFFRLLSMQKVSDDQQPRLISRQFIAALCNKSRMQLGAGHILVRTSANITREIIGGRQEKVSEETFKPPQPIDPKFSLAFEAAEIACAKADYTKSD